MKLGTRGKAGISWPVQERTSDPVAKFFEPGSKLSWHWNWNKNYQELLPESSPGLVIDAEFVPMIFAPDHVDNEYKLQPGWRHLLGFNEPDHDDASVATAVTPAVAARAWKKVAAMRTSPEQQLISPAIAWNAQWLKDFLSMLEPSEKPSILAIHIYTTTFDSFRDKVEEYRRTFGLPIVVTEFAMTSFDPNVPPPKRQQEVHDFMGQTTAWMDETDYIVGYSWFGAVRDPYNLHGVHPFNRLMDEQGNVTPLGHQYINGGHA